jgi:hypothetical protein
MSPISLIERPIDDCKRKEIWRHKAGLSHGSTSGLQKRQGERIFSFELARYPIEAAKKIRPEEHLSGDFPES